MGQPFDKQKFIFIYLNERQLTKLHGYLLHFQAQHFEGSECLL